MTDPETSQSAQLVINWIYILMAIFGVFVWGFMFLYTFKLDKAVFEEHQKSISAMQTDIRAIRDIMDQHAIQPNQAP